MTKQEAERLDKWEKDFMEDCKIEYPSHNWSDTELSRAFRIYCAGRRRTVRIKKEKKYE